VSASKKKQNKAALAINQQKNSATKIRLNKNSKAIDKIMRISTNP
jgi:hypothetical protein